MKTETQLCRDLIAQFVEDLNADSLVVMWTSVGKDQTSAKIATWGNQLAVRDMVRQANLEYELATKAKIVRKTKYNDQ